VCGRSAERLFGEEQNGFAAEQRNGFLAEEKIKLIVQKRSAK
jgi:hypothetical protein